MPDEDLNIGTETTTSNPSSDSSQSTAVAEPSTEAQAESSEQNGAVETEVAAPSKQETVGAALDAFTRAKGDSYSASPAKQSVVAPTHTPRDYSVFPPEAVPLFKKMGDTAFNTLKPQYMEYLKLKTENAALKAENESTSKYTFFEHEGAYKLTPEYTSYSENVNHLDAEISHWQEQIAKIRNNEEWTPIVLDPQGQPVLGKPVAASAQGEAVVMNALMQANVLKSQEVNKLENLKSNFTTQYKGFSSKMAEVENKIFEGADKTALAKAMETKLPMFPKFMHKQPVVQTLAKALAVIDGLMIMLQERQSTNTTNTIKARTAVSAGPNGGAVQASNGKADTVGSAVDEFKRARGLGIA